MARQYQNDTEKQNIGDHEIFDLIRKEQHRQRYGLEMIPSENHSSKEVKAAQGSIMMDKYAEGYPGKRYYGGCEYHDEVENIAIERLKRLFGAEHANVQPHAGSQANMAAYSALLKPGDKILAMELSHGGHLTHGSKVNFSGNKYKFVHYQVHEETHLLDYNKIEDLAREHRPKAIVAGYTAYPREIDFSSFRDICDKVDARLFVDMAHIAGLVAGKAHQNPVPYADIVTSTTHKTLRGPRGGFILSREEHAKAIDKAVFPGMQGGPFMNSIAAKAICFREALEPGFADYAGQVVKNSRALASALKEEGLDLVTGGSDNHLILLNLLNIGVKGRQAQEALNDVGISVNMNTIPYDPSTPFNPSGVRIGTPALTTRGMKEKDMDLIAEFYSRTLKNIGNEKVMQDVRKGVEDLASRYPLPGGE